MKRFVFAAIAASFVVGSASFADEQLPLPLPNPNEARDFELTLKKIENGEIEFNIGNGDYGVDVVGPKQGTITKAKRAIANRTRGFESCGFVTTAGEAAWQNLMIFQEHTDQTMEGLEALLKLEESNQIKFVIERTWDGEGDKSESCSLNYYDIYFKNGKKLRLDFDFTT